MPKPQRGSSIIKSKMGFLQVYRKQRKICPKAPEGRQVCRIESVYDNLDKLSLVARFQLEQNPTIEYEPLDVQLRKSY